MAQTKTKSSARKSPPKARAKSNGSKARAKSAAAKTRSKPKAASSKPAKSSSKPARSKSSPAKTLGQAKIPLLAGGAALAGTVGGVVLGASRSGSKVLGVKLPEPKRVKFRSKDLASAAKQVGRFGENVGDLTSELKRAREGLANGDGAQSSPIEVLLRGLTNRR